MTGADGFTRASYGARDVGFGERAAVLVVDFQRAFTDPAFPMGRSDHVDRAVDATARLLSEARAMGVPVAVCNVGWTSEREMARWKVEACYSGMAPGDPGLEIDPRLVHPDDYLFTKTAPSMFFATPLLTFLHRERVDTVIVTGCTTSGCVRATIVDAFSHGYHTIVAEPCCGDQEAAAHEATMRDVGRRYADVLALEPIIEQLKIISGKQNG